MKPLTRKESQIAELVGAGLPVPTIVKRLAEQGIHMAASTVQGHIVRIATKLDNPYELPPKAAIKHWWKSRAA